MGFKTLKDIDNHQTNQIAKYISILQKADCFRPKEKKEVIAWLTHQMKLFDLIKQEAIKQVKEWKSDKRLSYPTATIDINAPLALIQLELETKIKAFKHFFNITEEDLKDE